MQKTWMVAVAMLAVTLAGCSDADDSTTDTETTTTQPAQGDPGDGNQTETKNQPPSVMFSSDVGQGVAPLQVNFTLNGTDPDGDVLAWNMTFGLDDPAEGQDLNATVTRTFTAEGEYIVEAFVTDGNATVSANITIIVDAAAQQAPGPVVFTGTSFGSPVGCALSATGELYHYYDAELADLWLFTVEGEGTAGTVFTEWWDGDSHTVDLGASGTIPTPSDNVAVCTEVPEPLEYTLTLRHPDYAG